MVVGPCLRKASEQWPWWLGEIFREFSWAERGPGYLILWSAVCRGEGWPDTSFLVTARERQLRVFKFSFNLFIEVTFFFKGRHFYTERDTQGKHYMKLGQRGIWARSNREGQQTPEARRGAWSWPSLTDSEVTGPVHSLSLDLWPLELWDNAFMLFKPFGWGPRNDKDPLPVPCLIKVTTMLHGLPSCRAEPTERASTLFGRWSKKSPIGECANHTRKGIGNSGHTIEGTASVENGFSSARNWKTVEQTKDHVSWDIYTPILVGHSWSPDGGY